MDSTNISLLHRLQTDENEVAWERFVELYAPLIFHWGCDQGLTKTDAAELVQEVLVILVTKLPEFQYDPQRRFRGWLRNIARNKANDFHRRNRVRPGTGQQETIQHAPDPSETDDLFEEVEYRQFLLNHALQIMRAEFRDETWQACWKQVVDGRKPSDVAGELQLPLNVVYLAKSRVLARLREEMDGLLD